MNILIAMPTLGHIGTPTVKSLIALTQTLREHSHGFTFVTYEFSDIVFSRNVLMSKFFGDARYERILLLDSDISFAAHTVIRMLEFNEDFMAAPYAQKFIPWTKVTTDIEANAAAPEKERKSISSILSRNWRYNLTRVGFGNKPEPNIIRNGFMTASAAGTGFMLISRAVPEKMVAAGLARHYPRHANLVPSNDLQYHDFFSHLPTEDGQGLHGEDESFCKRWVHHLQETLWVDTEARLTHTGLFGFQSRYSEHIDLIKSQSE